VVLGSHKERNNLLNSEPRDNVCSAIEVDGECLVLCLAEDTQIAWNGEER